MGRAKQALGGWGRGGESGQGTTTKSTDGRAKADEHAKLDKISRFNISTPAEDGQWPSLVPSAGDIHLFIVQINSLKAKACFRA